jgi:hypothetical protein
MTKFTSAALFTLTFAGASALFAQMPAAPAPAAAKAPMTPTAAPAGRLSPHETISAYVGGTRRTGTLITITSGRPYSAKGGAGDVRKIWGGLVPWGKADRLGSDEATLLVTPVPLIIGATTIPAGAYTLYIVPSETGVTKLAFSSNIGKWGIPVDETHDVARVDLKKGTVDKRVDQLTLALADVPATPNSGVLTITWETTQFTLPFAVKKG